MLRSMGWLNLLNPVLTTESGRTRGRELWLPPVCLGEIMKTDTNQNSSRMQKLHAEAYHVMQVMNGINPGDPTYNVDQNIDNYKKTM